MQNFFRETKGSLQFERRKKNLDFPPHIHDDVELIFMISGSAKAYCAGREYLLKTGDFFLVFPNTVHWYSESSTDCEIFIVTVKAGFLMHYGSVFTNKLTTNAVYSSGETDGNLIELLHIAFDEYQSQSDNDVISGLLTVIFGKLLKHYQLDNNAATDCVSEILQYCEEHYKEDISIERISKELHISRSHISHTFNSKLKLGFCNYINSLRLIEAVRILENGRHSIIETAHLSGFSTVRTFNRAFRKQYGVSPSKYRFSPH